MAEFTAEIPQAEAANPFAKYRPQGAADNPFAKYRQQSPEAAPQKPPGEGEGPGFFERMWDGLTGKDVSRAGRFGMGVADPFYGGAQIGARMAAQPGGGVPEAAGVMMPDPRAEERIKTVDTAVQNREAEYQQREKAAGLTGNLFNVKEAPDGNPENAVVTLGDAWARLLGNVASPPNVAAGAMTGAAAPLGAAGRIGASAALGAASGAMSPVASGDFGTEKAKQAGFGAVGGAMGGAAGEVTGSWLGRAIAGNSPQAIDQAITSKFRSVVKPGRGGQTSEQSLGMQDRRILTAVDQIMQNRPNLQLTDEAGNQLRGALPRSLRQFTEAIDQTKRSLFKQYDAMAQSAEGQGVRVDLAPAIQHLRDVAQRPEIADFHPNLAVEAEQLARNFEVRGFYPPGEAQDVIQNLNATLKGFDRNPTHETVSRSSLLAPVASLLREGLDAAITGAEGPGYQALRLQYGALRSIEKDVAGAVQREANKLPGGIGGIFANLAVSEEVLRGIITINPKALMRAGEIKAAQAAVKYINSPNRAITRLFERAATRNNPPPGMLRQGAGAALSGAGPYGALIGAQTMEGMNRPPPLEFPSTPGAR